MLFSITACKSKVENEPVEEFIEDSDIITEEAESSENTTEWQSFLVDYEEWVDTYIELLEEYKNDPTDLTILEDYTEMLAELTEWTEKTEEIESELASSPEDLLAYSTELSRIATKLAEVSY